MWDEVKAWFKYSLTILWARAVALAGLLLAAALIRADLAYMLLRDCGASLILSSRLRPESAGRLAMARIPSAME